MGASDLQVACECVCDLYGLEMTHDDLKGVLLIAATFPETPFNPDEPVQEQEQEQEVVRAVIEPNSLSRSTFTDRSRSR